MTSIGGGPPNGFVTADLHCGEYRQERQRIESKFILKRHKIVRNRALIAALLSSETEVITRKPWKYLAPPGSRGESVGGL
jgi:hypothetical protein